MCKLIINVDFEPSKNNADFLQVNKALFELERDGVSVLNYSGKKAKMVPFTSISTAVDYLNKQVATNTGVFGLHTRTATSGLKTKDNLHFWIKDNYSFAHNGIVSQLSGVSQKVSDSKLFFDLLLRNLKSKNKQMGAMSVKKKVDLIAEQIDNTYFSGVAFLIDIKNKLIYLIGTRDIDVYSDMRTFVSFVSFEALTTYVKNTEYAGFIFSEKDKELPIEHNVLESGIYVYDVSKRKVLYKREITRYYYRNFVSFNADRDSKFDNSIDVESKDEGSVIQEDSEKHLERKNYLVY